MCTLFSSCSWEYGPEEMQAFRPNERDILLDGGCPFVNFDLPTLRYADVFPGRVDPLDDPAYRAAVIEARATPDYERFAA